MLQTEHQFNHAGELVKLISVALKDNDTWKKRTIRPRLKTIMKRADRSAPANNYLLRIAVGIKRNREVFIKYRGDTPDEP